MLARVCPRWLWRRGPLGPLSVIVLLALVACGGNSSTANSNSTPPPGAVATEDSPPGDIPDNQAFVRYQSPNGYSFETPEGWARQESPTGVSFTDKLNSVTAELSQATTAPTVDSATTTDIPALAAKTDAFEQVTVKSVSLPSGPAVLICYRANSAADAVTGKQTRLEIDRYEYFKDGQLLALSLSAPAGSDNVDAWNQIAKSFTWG
jgi:hypothetical protein